MSKKESSRAKGITVVKSPEETMRYRPTSEHFPEMR